MGSHPTSHPARRRHSVLRVHQAPCFALGEGAKSVASTADLPLIAAVRKEMGSLWMRAIRVRVARQGAEAAAETIRASPS